LKRPSDAQDLVQQVLQLATTKSDNADLRDRGYVYWRLLSSDPNVTKVCFFGIFFFFLRVFFKKKN